MKAIFIAGKYKGKDFNEIGENIRLAERYAIEVWNLGYGAFCPHLNTAHFEVKAKAREDAYRQFDKKMLRACDAVLALPGWDESQGAKEEITEAKRLGLRIYHSLDDLKSHEAVDDNVL